MYNTVAVTRDPDPTLSAVTTLNIGCTAGTITVTHQMVVQQEQTIAMPFGSKDGSGTDLYASVGDILGAAYQSSPVFTFGWETITDDLGKYNKYVYPW